MKSDILKSISMNYLYYCVKCNSLIASKREDARFRCVSCNEQFIPLQITMDSWNNLSDAEKQSLLNGLVEEDEIPSENRNVVNIETISTGETDRENAILKEQKSCVNDLVECGIDVGLTSECSEQFTPLKITAASWNNSFDVEKQSLFACSVEEVETPSENINIFQIDDISASEKDRKNAILKELHSYVNNLVEHGIDVEPPGESDECVLIPINCWFDKKVYIALYLLRYHKITGIKLSYHELPQLQVFVKKDNIELIVQSCSMTTLSGGNEYWEKDYTYIDTYNHVRNNHPITLWYLNHEERTEIILNNEVDISRYEEWEKEYRNNIYEKAIAEYGKMEYNSEFRLFFFVRFLFPDAVYQFHAEWLGQQSLDIFIQSINVGIEYQGEQHYKPVDFFGGESKLEQQQKMDFEKKQKCAKHGVKLFEWPYNKWITERNLLENAAIWYPGDSSWITHEYLLYNMKRMCPRTIDDFLNSIQTRRHEGRIGETREQKKKKPKKPKNVYRKYDYDGAFIKEYSSATDAAQDCSVSVAAIMKACTGKQRTAAGHQWRIEAPDSTINGIAPLEYTVVNNSFGSSRPVIQIDEDGVIVKKYASISEASRVMGVGAKSIRAAASGLQKRAAGYYWVFDTQT